MEMRRGLQRILLVLVLGKVFLFPWVNAQTPKINSLKKALKESTNDTAKVDLLYQLGAEYWDFDFEIGLEYAQQCLALAESLGDAKGMAQGNTNMGLYYYFQGDYVQAQTYYWKALKALDGKVKGDFPGYTLTRIGNLHRVQSAFDSALHYYDLSIVSLKGQEPGLAMSSTYHNLGLFWLSRANYNAASTNFLAALELRTALQDTLLMAESWRGLGTVYLDKRQYDSAEFYLTKIKAVADHYNNPELEMYYTLYFGQVLYEKGALLQSIEHLNQSLDILKQHNFKRYHVLILNTLGKIYAELGEFDKASKLLFEALELNKSLMNQKQEADIYVDLSWVYYYEKNKGLSEEYAQRAFRLYQAIDYTRGIARAYNLYGTIALEWKEYTKALLNFNKALELTEGRDWQRFESVLLFNSALVYEAQGLLEDSYELQLEALVIEETLNNPLGRVISYNYLGKISQKMGFLKRSQDYLIKARYILDSVRSPINKQLNAKFLAEVSSELNDFEKAAQYYKEYIDITDSIYKEESLNKSLQLNSLYQLEEKENEIIQLNKNKELQLQKLAAQKEQLAQQQVIILLTVATVLIFIIFLVVLYFYNKKISKSRDTLKRLNNEVQVQKEAIQAQSKELTLANSKITSTNESLEKKVDIRTKELKEALQELDTFFYRSSHDFRRPLTTFLGLAEVAKVTVKDPAALSLFEKVKDNADALDQMLRKLQSMTSVAAENMELTEFSINRLLETLVQKFHGQLEEKSIKVEIHSTVVQNLQVHLQLLEIVLENLFENAIFFNEMGGYIVIQVEENKNTMELKMCNSGEVLDDQVKEKMFEMFYRGSANSHGNGLGLYLVKKATDKLEGSIEVHSNENGLTTLVLKIPMQPSP